MKTKDLHEIIGALVCIGNTSLANKLSLSVCHTKITNVSKVLTQVKQKKVNKIQRENERIKTISKMKPFEVYGIQVNKNLPNNITHKKFPYIINKTGSNIFLIHDPYSTHIRKTLSSTKGFLNTLWLFGNMKANAENIPQRPKDFKVVRSWIHCKIQRLNPETMKEKSIKEVSCEVFS